MTPGFAANVGDGLADEAGLNKWRAEGSDIKVRFELGSEVLYRRGEVL